MWTTNLAERSGPKYKRIADAIGESIRDGSLEEGDRLPAQRDLAYQLEVSLNTVSRAYADAIRRGFVDGEVGRGTFVRSAGPLPALDSQAGMTRPIAGPIDFSLNLPFAGASAEALAETLDALRVSPDLGACLDYQAEGDLERHADAGAAWIAQAGLDVSGDDVVLTNGAQHGLLVALMSTTRPGDVLLTESATYPPILAMARHLGLKVLPVPMDGEGLSPEALNDACRSSGAKVLYCLPTIHTPTTITMGADRRRAIAELAEAHDLIVVEDDVFGLLPEDRPPPLACFAKDRTLYVSSTSKSLAPGLRVGYVYVPERLRRSFRAAISTSSWMPPPLMAEIASRWIHEGTAWRLNEFQRQEAQIRQGMAARILGVHAPEVDPSAMHLWLSLPDHWRPDSFRAAAEKLGVKVLTSETFSVQQTGSMPAVRVCLSHEATRERVARGLEILAGLLNETTDPGVFVV